MAKRKGAAHVVPGGNGFRCMNCGDEQGFTNPPTIPVWVAAGKAYEKQHKKCKPGDAGAERMAYANVDQWRASWDTGISSETIFSVFKGYGAPRMPDVPHDPSDFGRCYRLLKVAPPEWRANLSRVTAKHPMWAGLVARWDECERLYEEELPTGSAPRLYALMQEIRKAPPDVAS